jgi:hypothetical protein
MLGDERVDLEAEVRTTVSRGGLVLIAIGSVLALMLLGGLLALAAWSWLFPPRVLEGVPPQSPWEEPVVLAVVCVIFVVLARGLWGIIATLRGRTVGRVIPWQLAAAVAVVLGLPAAVALIVVPILALIHPQAGHALSPRAWLNGWFCVSLLWGAPVLLRRSQRRLAARPPVGP